MLGPLTTVSAAWVCWTCGVTGGSGDGRVGVAGARLFVGPLVVHVEVQFGGSDAGERGPSSGAWVSLCVRFESSVMDTACGAT